MDFEAASKILGMVPDEINQEAIFNSYFKKYTNQIGIDKNTLTEAKNVLFRDIIDFQIQTTGRFEVEIPPAKNICHSCLGTGELYRLMIEVTVPCKYCNGTGVKAVKCKTCEGTGSKYGKPCLTCKGTGKYFYFKNFKRKETIPCKKCNGSGNMKIKKRAGNLTGSTTCLTCGGTGLNVKRLNTKKSNSLIDNKVITEEAAKRIKEKMDLIT